MVPPLGQIDVDAQKRGSDGEPKCSSYPGLQMGEMASRRFSIRLSEASSSLTKPPRNVSNTMSSKGTLWTSRFTMGTSAGLGINRAGGAVVGVGVGMGVGDGSAVAVGSLGVGSAVGAAAEEHASPVTTKTSSAKIRRVRIRDLQGR